MPGNLAVLALTNGTTLASACLPTIQVVDKRPMRSCGALVPECIVGNPEDGPHPAGLVLVGGTWITVDPKKLSTLSIFCRFKETQGKITEVEAGA